ncbi:hypothetical protein SAMN05444369_11918 [Capnocytophaga haemolytica]|jgi:lipoprotein|uniref:DUF4382 domain-containing protein n=1 Tax=Capnocytophaga haemolytica TaxID=45243 RepID=A0AAX2GYI3_9FLAO|nr:hypothetical protein [Capnocytophaga haemolytica]AMD84327.1 hypothetical protein AXF12_01515 [Capnocytophaga haemolytica]SFO30330.1 hypothetical protein SAMN05444369_11918 [Capnocytophaga haemolytica]SNV11754.1 Uncharacterised protein [Capnocytophaga haemolytica]
MKRILIVMVAFLGLMSCSKDSDSNSNSGSNGGAHTVKIQASGDVVLKSLTFSFTDGTTANIEVDELVGNGYTKTMDKAFDFVQVGAVSKSNDKNATLTLQVLEGDKVLKEVSASGAVLAPNIHLINTDSNAVGKSAHTVRIYASNNVELKTLTFSFTDNTTTNIQVDQLVGNGYTRTMDKAFDFVQVGAVSRNQDKNATLTLQVLEGDKVLKEVTASGAFLAPNIKL